MRRWPYAQKPGAHFPSSSLRSLQGDLRDPTSVQTALQGAFGAIFAASATRGASPYDVDRDGATSVARACVELGVAHFVLISAGGASKPNSPIFKYNNLYGGLMQAKFEARTRSPP